MNAPEISIKIDVVNLMEVANNLVAFRQTLVNGGFSAEEASGVAAAVLNRAMDSGHTSIRVGALADAEKLVAEIREQVKDYVISEVSKYLSRANSPYI